jgi:hypothetical protein
MERVSLLYLGLVFAGKGEDAAAFRVRGSTLRLMLDTSSGLSFLAARAF